MNSPIEFNDWLQLRCGRFTASEIYKLFVGGRRPMTEDELKEEKKKGGTRKTVDILFGDTAMSYIKMKAAERLTMQVKPENNFVQTTHGKENEYDAWRAYEDHTGQKGDYYGVLDPKFFEFGADLGGSPDWIRKDKKKGADFKCPYNSEEHLVNLMIKDQSGLKDIRWEYYCQNQFLMYHLKLDSFDFVSFDKRFIEDKYKLKIITCRPDIDWIKDYKVVEPAAIEQLNYILSQLN